jgi:hypothetical protein
MAKRILHVLLFSIITSGCCYKGIKSAYGLPRKKIARLSDHFSHEKIDTLALYKLQINYAYNKMSKEYIYFEKDNNNSYPYTSYLKFYKNGKLGLFILPKTDTLHLERTFFDPQKAKMGYFEIQGQSIKTKISTIGDCSLFISNKKGEIKGDSIKLEGKNNHGNIYIKVNVPKNILENWKPDW